MTCYACGAHETQRAQRGDLVTSVRPRAVWWKGKRLDLASRQHDVLHALCAKGSASTVALQRAIGGGQMADTSYLRGTISLLRRALPPDIRIKNDPDWGYELILKETDDA